MTQLPLVILEIAEHDIAWAMAEFEQKRIGFGSAFLLQIHETLAHIRWYPSMFQMIHPPLRRAVLHRFQFAIAYRILDEFIEVVAVIPNRGDPDILITRMENVPKI